LVTFLVTDWSNLLFKALPTKPLFALIFSCPAATRTSKMDASPTALYRKTTIGKALEDALASLMAQNLINSQLQEYIFQTFEQALVDAVSLSPTKGTIRGRLHTFRLYNGVWTFIVDRPAISFSDLAETAEFLKIVAVEATESMKRNH